MRWEDPARLMAAAQILKDRLLPDCAEHKTFRGPRAHGLGVHLSGAFYDRTTYRLCPQGLRPRRIYLIPGSGLSFGLRMLLFPM